MPSDIGNGPTISSIRCEKRLSGTGTVLNYKMAPQNYISAPPVATLCLRYEIRKNKKI